MNNIRNDTLLEKVGNRIRELQVGKGLSQDKLGKECDMSRNGIYRLEKGKINTTISILDAIAKAIGTTACELLKNI